MQIEIGLGNGHAKRALYAGAGAALLVALCLLGYRVTTVEAETPQVLTPERWQAARLARKAAAEVVRLDADMQLLADMLAAGKPEPVPAMLLAQRVYARQHVGTSATAPARLALIAAAEEAARYAAGAVERAAAVASLDVAAAHLASFRPDLPPMSPTASPTATPAPTGAATP